MKYKRIVFHASTQRTTGSCDWAAVLHTERKQIVCRLLVTSLSKVIWEEGRIAALSHTYAVKSLMVTMARPKFAPKVLLSVD